jgi:hypothetical protein
LDFFASVTPHSSKTLFTIKHYFIQLSNLHPSVTTRVADPDPAFHFNADPDPAAKIYAHPDPGLDKQIRNKPS